MRPKFNIDSIPPHDLAALRLCCDGFVQQQNAIFAELQRVLSIGGEVEIALPIDAEDIDLMQGIRFSQ